MDTGLAPASIVDAGFSRVAQWVGTGTREPPHLVRGHLRPQPRTLVAKVASYLSMTTVFERLSAALADRYAIEHELGAGGGCGPIPSEDRGQGQVRLLALRFGAAAVQLIQEGDFGCTQ